MLGGVSRSQHWHQPNRQRNWINYSKVNELGQYHATFNQLSFTYYFPACPTTVTKIPFQGKIKP